MNDQHPANRRRSPLLVVVLIAVAMVGVFVGATWHATFASIWMPEAEQRVASSGQLWTCGMHPQVIQDHPGFCPICHMALTPLEAEAHPTEGMLTIDPTVVQKMGVKTAVVVEGPVVRAVRATGIVAEAEPNAREINLLVSGWVRRLHADTEGIHIRRHAPLFDLYSPELHTAIEDAIRLRRSSPVRPTTEGEAAGGRSLYAAALRRLELWGLGSAQAERLSRLPRAPRSVTFTSPISGVLTEKRVVEGAAVKAGDMVMRIVDHRTVWIEAKVFEQHLAGVALGRTMTAEVAALPGETFSGEVVFVHPHVDMATRTAVVRFAVDNPDLRLRPGMYATVELDLELGTRALLVPREAVIDTGVRKIAFVSLGEGHFAAREVEVGRSDSAGAIEVLAGLDAGETVVRSGQFLLDAESRVREAVQKFLRERDGEGAEADPEPSVPSPAPGAEARRPPTNDRPRARKPKPPKPAREAPRDDDDETRVVPEPEPEPPPPAELYTCPMHGDVRHKGPGQCPVCGMDLVPLKKAKR